MSNRHLYDTDLSSHVPDPDSDKVDTVLMSGKGSVQVFDDLRQRYERRVESQEYQLLEGHGEGPAPLATGSESTNSEVSIEPVTHDPTMESDVPWYAWMLVVASSVLLLAAGAAAVVVLVG